MRTKCLLLLATALPCSAVFEPLFFIGEEDNRPNGFSREDGETTVGNGSPTEKDDHFYYPDEALENFERALTSWDPVNVIHFPLTQAQATNTAMLRVRVNFIWSGSDEEITAHEISFSLNGGSILSITPTFGENNYEHAFEVPLTSETLNVGDNTLRIERTAGSDNSWVSLDFVEARIDPTALIDADNDGLPLFWETQHLLSDTSSADAAGDIDNDSSTNLQEYQRGTNPRLADTDGDGLLDGQETNTDPLLKDSDDDGLLDGEEVASDPTLWDTDGDGASDSWELAAGYDPTNSGNTPPAWSGAIGINFRSEGTPEGGIWSTRTPNGLVPQINWNHTSPLRRYGDRNDRPLLMGSTADMISPAEGSLVDAAGTASAMTISFAHDGVHPNLYDETLTAKLLNGYLSNDRYEDDNDEEVQRPATITLGAIPFSSYDVYLYVSADLQGREGLIKRNGDAETEFAITAISVEPDTTFQEVGQTAGPVSPEGNVICFKNLTGASQTFELSRLDNNVTGFAAVQIIDRTSDSDGDSLPDFWEFRYRTGAHNSNANADPDGDGLTHAQELAAGSDPNSADTDFDGLSDSEEITANTNPLFADTDGDGLSDFEELRGALTSNPLNENSDNDNLTDFEEQSQYADPTDDSVAELPSPEYVNANQFHWEDNDVQLVINHNVPPQTRYSASKSLWDWSTRNLTYDGYSIIRFEFLDRNGRLHHNMGVSRSGAFEQENGRSVSSSTPSEENLYQAFGMAGRGSVDISDPITFRFDVTRTGEQWRLSYQFINQKTGVAVVDRTFENVTVDPAVANQTAVWGYRDVPGRTEVDLEEGVRVFRTKKALETLPAFSPYLDSDNDGITDAWETANGLNPNSPDDANLDDDSDTLTNFEEFIANTLPGNSDSDGDGFSDDIEVNRFTDPRSASSRPVLFSGTINRNTDLDGNGLSDLWESLYFAAGLSPGDDSDGDGFTNAQEAIMGTDPRDGSSYFGLSVNTSGNDVALQWPRLQSKMQTLYSSSDLENFTPHGQAPQALGDIYSLTMTPEDTGYFRVTLSDMDLDGDGLTDWEESVLGTNSGGSSTTSRPALYDSNNDGIPDGTFDGDYAAFTSLMNDREDLLNGATTTGVSERNAARLLLQATFGTTMKDIRTVQEMGIAGWIDDQIEAQPATLHRDYLREIAADFAGPRVDLTYRHDPNSDVVSEDNIQTAWARAALSGPDQLRQRVAFALSQILVVSRQDGTIARRIQSMGNYYDMLVNNAFGNYEDLLNEVTVSPIMGWYLSSVGNQKADPTINRFPDENYAREVQQLFSIGLWELNMDGTRKVDAAGNFIPTYTNDDITEFARVFTGLWYGKQGWGRGGFQDFHYLIPMDMHADYHDFGSKTLLNGFTLPQREASDENGMQDVRDTIHHLVTHPTCAPFISKALIQFLVTSNPSPGYVERVATVFAGDADRRAGDLKAVVKAILLDPEARDPGAALAPDYGIFREPLIRTIHLGRLLKVNRDQNLVWWDFGNAFNDTLQTPLNSPTVFNFFRPDYTSPGTLSDENLVGPAFEILNSFTSISVPNRFWNIINRGFELGSRYQFNPDLSELLPLVDDLPALLDRLNLLLCGGSMSAQTRGIILQAIEATDPEFKPGRVRLAIYLTIMSPDGSVQR